MVDLDLTPQQSVAACCSCTALLTFIIVISLSFQYVEHDEMALKKNSHTNTVSLDEVYDNGRYCWGPAYKVITFPSIYQRVNVKSHIANQEGVGMMAHFTFFYQLHLDGLIDLYKKYDIRYAAMLESQAQAQIKNTGITFEFNDFLRNREDVARNVSLAVTKMIETKENGKEKFPGVTAPLSKFFLGEVKLDSEDLMQTELNKAVTLENNEQKEFDKDIAKKEQETLNEMQRWLTNGTVAIAKAEANKERDIKIAQDDLRESVISARAEGLKKLIDALEIVDDEVRKAFLMNMAMLDNHETVVLNTDTNVHVYTERAPGDGLPAPSG